MIHIIENFREINKKNGYDIDDFGNCIAICMANSNYTRQTYYNNKNRFMDFWSDVLSNNNVIDKLPDINVLQIMYECCNICIPIDHIHKINKKLLNDNLWFILVNYYKTPNIFNNNYILNNINVINKNVYLPILTLISNPKMDSDTIVCYIKCIESIYNVTRIYPPAEYFHNFLMGITSSYCSYRTKYSITKKIFALFEKLNYVFSYDELLMVCSNGCCGLIKKNNIVNMILDDKLFNNVIEYCVNTRNNGVINGINYLDLIKHILHLVNELDYKISLNNIETAAKYYVCIPNIDKLGIPMENILKIQDVVEIFPYMVINKKLTSTNLYASLVNDSDTLILKTLNSEPIDSIQYLLNVAIAKKCNDSVIHHIINTYKPVINETTFALFSKYYKSTNKILPTSILLIKEFSKNVNLDDIFKKNIKMEDLDYTTEICQILQENKSTETFPELLNKIPINKKSTISIKNKHTKKIFGIKYEISFIELRKLLLNHFNKLGLVVNKKIIINTKIAEICNLQQGDVINIADLDKLIGYFI